MQNSLAKNSKWVMLVKERSAALFASIRLKARLIELKEAFAIAEELTSFSLILMPCREVSNFALD